MKNFRRIAVGAALSAAALAASPAALAGTSGHVGVFSDYVFRGLVAEGGAAVQGGIDYHGDSGLLAGIWVSNSNPFGGNEFDVYAGYLHALSKTVFIDVGVLHYLFTEDDEADGAPNVDTTEFFAGLTAGQAKFQFYYSPDYLDTDEDGYYYTGTWTQPIKDTVKLLLQVGYTDGDGAKLSYGDDYVDYSLTLAKTVREGLVFSIAFIDTNLKDEGIFLDAEDQPKFLVSAKQTFAF